MTRIAIAISSFNRPEMLKGALESFRRGGMGAFDTWVFQDGPRDQRDQELVERCAGLSRDFEHPQKTLELADRNVGCGINFIRSWETLLDVQRYDGIFFLEDDQRIVSNFFTYGLCLQRRMEKLDPLSMTQQFSAGCLDMSKAQQEQALSLDVPQLMECMGVNFQGFFLARKVWDILRCIVLEYRDRFLAPYADHAAPYETARLEQRDDILQWQADMLQGRCLPHGVGVDQILQTACIVKGVRRFHRKVPGMNNVGVVGLHTNEQSFRATGFDRIHIYSLPREKILTSIQEGDIERARF